LQILHGSVDGGAVDVYIAGEDTPLADDLGYGQTSGYVLRDAAVGNVDLEVYEGATAPADVQSGSATPIATINGMAVAAGQGYTAVAMGEVAQSSFDLVGLSEGFDPAAGGEARLRFVHAASAPDVGVDLYDPSNEAPCAGTVEVSSLASGAASAAGGELAATGAAAHVALCDAGDVVTTFTVDLVAGESAHVVIAGRASQVLGRATDALTGFVAATGVNAAGNMGTFAQDPVLYFLRGMNRGSVNDVCRAGGTPVPGAQDLPYGDLGEAIRVPADASWDLVLHVDDATADCPTGGSFGPYDMGTLDVAQVAPRGSASAVFIIGDSNANPPDTDAPHFVVLSESVDTGDAANATVQLLNGGSNLSQVDAGVAAGPGFGVWTDVDYEGSSAPGGATLAPGAYTIQMGLSDETGEDQTIDLKAELANVAFAAGARELFAFSGVVNPSAPTWTVVRGHRIDVSGGDVAWVSTETQVVVTGP